MNEGSNCISVIERHGLKLKDKKELDMDKYNGEY
jgi:hypothetical protein